MRTHKLMAIFLAVVASANSNANWVDSWVENATYGEGTTYETQNRKFITGGNFSVRSQVRTDYPLTISMPKISAGCGGIDGFMGGVSFLDADYLVDKLQRMMQAAPYIAMDMALKTMSKEFSDTLKAAEDMANALNNIQLNECQSMKPLVTAALNSDPEGMKSAMGEIANAQQIKEAGVRLWQEAKDKTADNDGKSPVDTAKETLGCPAAVNEIFGGGSVIAKVADKTGLASHADLIRGYFGDVVMTKAGNILVAQTVAACPENTDDHQGFLFGGSYGKNTAGVCSRQTGSTVHETIYTKVNSISNKLINNQPLSSDDIQFASVGMPLPIVKMLQVAIDDGTIDQQKTVLTDIAAATYSRRIADTFFSAAYQSLKLASDAAKDTTQTNNDKPCNMRIYSDGANRVRELLRQVQASRTSLNRNIDIAIKESTQFYEVTEKSRERFDNLKEEDNSFYRGN